MESKLNALKERIQAPYERKPNGTIGSEDESFVIRKDPRTSAPIAPRLRHNNRLWLELRRASGFVPVQGDKWHIMEGKDAFVEGVSEIVTDMGHQVEKVNKRAYTIEEAVANVVSGRRLVSEAAGIMGSVHVAPGLLPFNAPDRNAMVDKSRYTMLAELYNNDIYLMCINGSFQVHVKVGRDEAMDLLNASQASSVAEYAWFANSPILDGKDTGYHSHRGMTWLKLIARDEYRRELDRGRVGITGPYENWDSWLEELVDRSFLFTKRLNDDGSDRYLSIAGLSGLRNGNAYGVITFRDYIDKGSAVAYNPLTGKKERITLEDVDIAMHMHTWWTEARLTTHGTVEDRAPDNSGKTGHIAAMIAFKKGLYHNLKEAAAYADEFAVEELNRSRLRVVRYGFAYPTSPGEKEEPRDVMISKRNGEEITIQQFCERWIEIANKGLKSIGETKSWLDPISQITADRRNDADRIIEAWNNPRLSERERNEALLEIIRVDQ